MAFRGVLVRRTSEREPQLEEKGWGSTDTDLLGEKNISKGDHKIRYIGATDQSVNG